MVHQQVLDADAGNTASCSARRLTCGGSWSKRGARLWTGIVPCGEMTDQGWDQREDHERKGVVLRLLETLPANASIEDIQYHLYVLQKIRAGEEAASAGKVIPHEEVMRELAEWLE
jgi:hypothetical protein